MPLDDYRRKRDFTKTPEPSGDRTRRAGKTRTPKPLYFCAPKHLASRVHYDLRLEHDAVLLSWAAPKGPSLDPRDKHMAVRTEDHPYDYGDFEGVMLPATPRFRTSTPRSTRVTSSSRSTATNSQARGSWSARGPERTQLATDQA